MNKLKWAMLQMVIWVSVSLFSVTVAAEEKPPGEIKFEACSGCHSRPGYANAVPRYQVPKLAGQHAGYLKSSIKAYAKGDRTHATMVGNAVSISDQDIGDIVAYLESFDLVKSNENYSGDPLIGKEKSASCIGCHGEGGDSSDGNFPKLSGQYQSYLIVALQDYKLGKRNNPMMNAMVASLSDDDIENIAAYYASQKKGLGVVER